jgi:type II secretory pathway component PulF
MDSKTHRFLTIGSWILLFAYLLLMGFGTLAHIQRVDSFAMILDQLGGTLPFTTRISIMLNDLLKSYLWIALVLFCIFLIYKEIKWKSKVQTLVFNNVVFVVTLVLGFLIEVTLMIPMFGVMRALSQ